MSTGIEEQIPKFLFNDIIYCCRLNIIARKSEKFILVLTKKLKLYEFQQKQMISSVDLCETCLDLDAEILEKLKNYNGSKGHLYDKHFEDDGEVSLGKFIYRNHGTTILYVLLSLWDKLIVLERLNDGSQGYAVIEEYKNVKSYRIIPSEIRFHSVLEIEFINVCGNSGGSDKIQTDFHNCTSTEENEEHKAQGDQFETRSDEYKKKIQKMLNCNTDLEIQRERTSKYFEKLRDEQHFGRNPLRLDCNDITDKQLLNRFGDVWMRFITAKGNMLVIGIPLMCGATFKNILRNLKPILKVNCDDDKGANPIRGVYFEYRLYQLKQNYESLENMDAFLECVLFDTDADDDGGDEKNIHYTWNTNEFDDNHAGIMLSESFGVLLMKLQITQIIALRECPLFVYFEVHKMSENKDDANNVAQIYEQQIFIKNLNFSKILAEREKYQITFNPCVMQQDFLALVFTSYATKFMFQFATMDDLLNFKTLLERKMEFISMKPKQKEKRNSMSLAMELLEQDENENEDEDENMNENGANTTSNINIPNDLHSLYYNKNPNSLWYGALAIQEVEKSHEAYDLETYWTFYTRTEDQAFLFIKLLFEDLIANNCNIVKVEYNATRGSKDAKIIEFENALRQELAYRQQIDCSGSAKVVDSQNNSSNAERRKQRLMEFENLAKLQLETDLLMIASEHSSASRRK